MEAYKQFVFDIIKGRIKLKRNNVNIKKGDIRLTEAKIKEFADGRIFTGQWAFENGFVDKLGDLFEAEEIAKKLACKRFKDVSDPKVEIYDKPQDFSEFIMEATGRIMPKSLVKEGLPASMSYPKQPLWLME